MICVHVTRSHFVFPCQERVLYSGFSGAAGCPATTPSRGTWSLHCGQAGGQPIPIPAVILVTSAVILVCTCMTRNQEGKGALYLISSNPHLKLLIRQPFVVQLRLTILLHHSKKNKRTCHIHIQKRCHPSPYSKPLLHINCFKYQLQ